LIKIKLPNKQIVIRFISNVTIIATHKDAMYTEIIYVTLLHYKYINPMEYTVDLIRKKGLVYPVPA